MLQRATIAPITEYGYGRDWLKFAAFCTENQLAALPANSETLSLFIADQLVRDRKVSTICRYASAVAYRHRRQGYDSPLTQTVKDVLWGARRLKAEQPRQMIPLTIDQVRQISAALAEEGTPAAMRDRLIIVLGFASALRRSNLSSMLFEDLTFRPEGFTIQIRREKQDRASEGRLVAIPRGEDKSTCPVRCLEAWLEHRGRDHGPLFTRLDRGRTSSLDGLSQNGIWEAVKGAVAKAGVDATQRGPHSLRAGCITTAAENGVNHLVLAAHTGHRSLDSLKRYFRPVNLFKANAAGRLGL